MFSKIRIPLARSNRVVQTFVNPKVFGGAARSQFAVRSFSAVPPVDPNTPTTPSSIPSIPSVDDLATNQTVLDAANTAADWNLYKHDDVNWISSAIMNGIEHVHTMVGIPYWEVIALVTVVLRVFMFPIALKTVQGSARMAVMRPVMQELQDRMKADPHIDDMKVKLRYQTEMKAVFAKFDVNPLRAMIWPFTQLPIFLGLFFALRDMGAHYPDFATGGAFWFTDLSVADPLYIWPTINALTFLAMIELGSDGMASNQKGMFKNIMRGMAVLSLPVTATMPAGLFMYWGTNNVISIVQTLVLKQEGVRKYFNIPKPPDVSPDMKITNPFTRITETIENEKSKGLDAKPEFLEGPTLAKKSPTPEVKPAEAPATFYRPPVKKADKRKK